MLLHERRMFAAVIDICICLALSLILQLVVPHLYFTNWMRLLIFYFIISFIYTFLWLLISKDQTLGLYLLSLKILNRDWSKPSLKAIFLRSLIHAVPVLYLVNMLYMVLNHTQTTFFDELSDTFVVKTGASFTVEELKKEENDNQL